MPLKQLRVCYSKEYILVSPWAELRGGYVGCSLPNNLEISISSLPKNFKILEISISSLPKIFWKLL